VENRFLLWVLALFGVVTAALYWLAFFPPVAYRRWLLAPATPGGY
jgi:hypothetical protein